MKNKTKLGIVLAVILIAASLVTTFALANSGDTPNNGAGCHPYPWCLWAGD